MKQEKRMRNFLCVLFFMCIGSTLKVAAQDFVVKTNAVGWASASINGGVETHLTGRWTGGVNLSYNPWTFSENMKWKHIYVSPEVRYWLCSPFAGHFFGANLIYTHYNAGNISLPLGLSPELKEERHQGDLGGVGLFYGYSWILSNRWSIEAELGLGYGYARYKRYNCVKCGTYKGTEDKHMLMPTKAAISIIYNIK
jgi:hypothetical protein